MLENEFDKAGKLLEQLKTYINTEIALAKLSVADKVSTMVSNLIAAVFVAMVGLLFTLFLSLALALLIVSWLGKLWAGFLVIAAAYLLLGILAWVTREKLLRIPIMNAIIRQLFTKESNEGNVNKTKGEDKEPS